MTSLKDQRGVALTVALIALVALTGSLIVLLGLGSTESLVGASHTEYTDARFVTEAGIEWAYDNLANNPNWNAVLLGPDGLGNTADDGVLATALTLPGLPAAAGTFSITIRNDTQAGDPQITGVATDAGGPFNDTNNRVVITAGGSSGTTNRTIQVVLYRLDLPPVVAPLSFPGTEAKATFNGNAFKIQGYDINMDDTAGPEKEVWGIAVSNDYAANESVVENALTPKQEDNIAGLAGMGSNTISPDSLINSSVVDNFVRKVKDSADVKLTSTAASPLLFDNIGKNCDSDPSSDTCWGTVSSPKLTYIKGKPDPTGAYSTLTLAGSTSGAGILIVEHGDVAISGNFHWDGIIIVTGEYVGLSYEGGGWQTVYGSIFVNEEATQPGLQEGLVSGNAKMNYSSQAVTMARQMRKLLTLGSWREM